MAITGGAAAPEAAMNRVVLSVFVAVALFGLGWATARGSHVETGVCALMTPEKLLENPGLARQYDEALRSGDGDELGRVADMLREIRGAHGCEGELLLPPAAPRAHPALPPGHPPVHGPSMDDRGPRSTPLFGAQGTVTILSTHPTRGDARDGGCGGRVLPPLEAPAGRRTSRHSGGSDAGNHVNRVPL
jgi:hypothetical protein